MVSVIYSQQRWLDFSLAYSLHFVCLFVCFSSFFSLGIKYKIHKNPHCSWILEIPFLSSFCIQFRFVSRRCWEILSAIDQTDNNIDNGLENTLRVPWILFNKIVHDKLCE